MSMESIVDEEFSETFKLTESIIKLLGLRVFYTKEKMDIMTWLKNYFGLYLTFFGLSHIIVGEIIYMINADLDFSSFVDMLMCWSFSFVGTVKVFGLYVKRHVVQHFFEEVHELWPRPDANKSVHDIKKRCLKRLTLTIKTMFYVYMSFLSFYNFDPLANTLYIYMTKNECNRLLPYRMWYPIDMTKVYFYPITYLHHVWAGYATALGFVAQDCVYQTMCSHLAMLLEILHDDILNIIPEEWSHDEIANNEAFLKQKLNDIIKRHQKLILMTEGVENACSFLIALNMVAGSVIICFMGFLATVMGLANIVKYMYSTISTLMQVFILTWYANLLIEKSTGLSHAFYHSRWYDCSVGFKRSMLILMIRSDRPLHVTALKFTMISLNTFTRIAGNSWSYFTLLRKVYEP